MYCIMSKTLFMIFSCFSIWCIGAIIMLYWCKKIDKPKAKSLFWLTSWFGIVWEIFLIVKERIVQIFKK